MMVVVGPNHHQTECGDDGDQDDIGPGEKIFPASIPNDDEEVDDRNENDADVFEPVPK